MTYLFLQLNNLSVYKVEVCYVDHEIIELLFTSLAFTNFIVSQSNNGSSQSRSLC